MRAIAPLLAILCSIACSAGNVEPGGQDAGPVCGDGVRQGNEECDKGAQNGANAGCERDCTYSCIPFDPIRGDRHCDPHDACKGQGNCADNHVCTVSGGLPDGSPCGNGGLCRDGACQTPVCGDGVVTAPEECDDGVNDGSHGCNSSCKFVCVSTDSARNCAPADPCEGASTCDDATHTCSARTPLHDGSSCGDGQVCQSGHCVSSSCASAGDCSPCDSGGVCKAGACVASVCGDGCRDTSKGEQCDDGNVVNLDGCDSHCKFEQNQRAIAVHMLYATDSYCTHNALGGAVGSNAQSTLQGEIDTAISNGTMNVMFAMLGLADPTGQNGTLQIGGVTGNPVAAPLHQTYSGTSDLDWWYTTQADTLDGSRVPKNQIPASISHTNLATTGTGSMTLTLVIGSGPVQLNASGVKLKASIGTSSAPTETVRGQTPGHIIAEHLDPALTAFGSMGAGELCGNISASSLKAAPVAQSLQTGGSVPCDEGYGPGNNMLDVIVGGCTKNEIITTIVIFSPTQPDQVDPGAPAAGAGGPYKFSMSGGSVSACKDKNGSVVDLTTCERAAAYSSALTFNSDRVILK
jgi:cysteine-rich repeat protein